MLKTLVCATVLIVTATSAGTSNAGSGSISNGRRLIGHADTKSNALASAIGDGQGMVVLHHSSDNPTGEGGP